MKSYDIGISAASYDMPRPQQRSAPDLKTMNQIASSSRINIEQRCYDALCYGASAAVVMLYRRGVSPREAVLCIHKPPCRQSPAQF